MINVRLGFDLTDILSPENIPGIKAYLGVKSDSDLTTAILQNKFNQISDLVIKNGFNIVDAEVQTVKSKKKDATTEKSVNKEVRDEQKEQETNQEIKDATNDKELFDKKQVFLKRILKIINRIKKSRGSIEAIKYSPEIIPYAPSPEEIKHEARMGSDVTIDVEDIDDGLLATVSYIDNAGDLKVELLKEEK